ncbi:helix-turn-helix transcriptional regulator [Ruminococcus sp.]|uniref:helix-turn-helix domain-containing protein n=1 Tax=Ruminococcus sp. TaxID=41978 RepID=UPI0025D2A926|nr:helix-turn-helix transcriptional regulator [Ruminococcus sp.]
MIRIKLDKLLEERGMSRYRLAQLTETKYQVIDNYYKNRVVRYDGEILSRICAALDCNVGDILEYEK